MNHEIGVEINAPGVSASDLHILADSTRSSLQKLTAQDSAISSAVVTIRRPDEQRREDVVEATILVHSDPSTYKSVGVSHSPLEALKKAIKEIENQVQAANLGQ